MTPPDPGFPITLDGLLKFWQLIGIPIFGAVVYYVRDISKQLRLMNGRIIKLEALVDANKEATDGRFKETRRELDQIQRRCEETLKRGSHTYREMEDMGGS